MYNILIMVRCYTWQTYFFGPKNKPQHDHSKIIKYLQPVKSRQVDKTGSCG